MINAIIALPTSEDQALANEVLHDLGCLWGGGQTLKDKAICSRDSNFAIRISHNKIYRGSVRYYQSEEGQQRYRARIPEHLFCCTLEDFLAEMGLADSDDMTELPALSDIL